MNWIWGSPRRTCEPCLPAAHFKCGPCPVSAPCWWRLLDAVATKATASFPSRRRPAVGGCRQEKFDYSLGSAKFADWLHHQLADEKPGEGPLISLTGATHALRSPAAASTKPGQSRLC